MIAQYTYKIKPEQLYGMRPQERDKYRVYREEVEKRLFANYLLGPIKFTPAGPEDTYSIRVITSSEDRYLEFKNQVKEVLRKNDASYFVFDRICELFKQFETKE